MIHSHGFHSRFGTTLTGISKLSIRKCYAELASYKLHAASHAPTFACLGRGTTPGGQSHVVRPLSFHLRTHLRGPFGRAFHPDRTRGDQLCIFGSRPFSQ